MDLWIRSQDKMKLVKINNISYMDMAETVETQKHSLWNDCKGILGTYKTKERALEVLDEIQAILEIKLAAQFGGDSVGDVLVKDNFSDEEIEYIARQLHIYEMPKE